MSDVTEVRRETWRFLPHCPSDASSIVRGLQWPFPAHLTCRDFAAGGLLRLRSIVACSVRTPVSFRHSGVVGSVLRTGTLWQLRTYSADGFCAGLPNSVESRSACSQELKSGQAGAFGFADFRTPPTCVIRGLTSELTGAQRHGAWAARTMINKPAARPRAMPLRVRLSDRLGHAGDCIVLRTRDDEGFLHFLTVRSALVAAN